jgi:hypothetical protein
VSISLTPQSRNPLRAVPTVESLRLKMMPSGIRFLFFAPMP